MCTGGGANVTPFTLPRPLFYSHAHKGFSMILVHFYIDRSRIGLLGFQSKGTRHLWAWPWGLDLCGRGKSSLCSLGPCPQGHAHKATPTKASSHFWNPREGQFSIDRWKISQKSSVAIKSGRGNVKGVTFAPPPCAHIFSFK